MPLNNKKLTIYFPDDWEDTAIKELKDIFEKITLFMGYDGISYEIQELEKE